MKRNKQDDRITLAGIKIFPRIGVTAEERSSAQKCEADLSIWDNFEGAASMDSISKAVDYGRLLSVVQDTALDGEFVLLETLAYRIVRNIVQQFPIDRARVAIRKWPASMEAQVDYVEIEVEGP